MSRTRAGWRSGALLACGLLGILSTVAGAAPAPGVFVRARVEAPAKGPHKLTFGGRRHVGPTWSYGPIAVDVEAGAWSRWVDVSGWDWHPRADRSGGLAEWPAMTIEVTKVGGAGRPEPLAVAVAVQLAERADADEKSVVHSFVERAESGFVGFLVPNPLRERAAEFETGSAMAARHQRWAREAVGRAPIRLTRFDVSTWLWRPLDRGAAAASIEALRWLGFNVVAGAPLDLVRAAGMRSATQSPAWDFTPDPEALAVRSRNFFSAYPLPGADPPGAESDLAWSLRTMSWLELGDETRAPYWDSVPPAKRDAWFLEYLRARGAGEASASPPPVFPAAAIKAPLRRDAPLAERRILYQAAKFNHWTMARLLRQATELAHARSPGLRTSTLPSDHAFLDAWGPPCVGMSAVNFDPFELVAQRAVDQLIVEDWLGLNHMYGPPFTWTGAQTFEYLHALYRSAIDAAAPTSSERGPPSVRLASLITPSDDRYLRLKAASGLGQGSRAIEYWTFGPTWASTENYWSDLRSEYLGIAHVGRALERAEGLITQARPVRDPVAIVASVSHDLWWSDDPAVFSERRLLWHALRHLGVQPDFLREEQLEGGALANYRALYLVDYCLSRRASLAIDAWVRAGGVLYLGGGAATCDEHAEPWIPEFARGAWPEGASAKLQRQGTHNYNERYDLDGLKPLGRVDVALPTVGGRGEAGTRSFSLPVIGGRLGLAANVASLGPPPRTVIARFSDGDKEPAGVILRHGEGTVIALGFLPGLAYGALAGFKPKTLEERWPDEPRRLFALALEQSGVVPAARPAVPVVEASLLEGPAGAVVVLANYTYQKIAALPVEVTLPFRPRRIESTEGARVAIVPLPGGRYRLTLPLDCTDLILLYP